MASASARNRARAAPPACAPARTILRAQRRLRRDLAGQVDDPHATAAQLAEDFIALRFKRLQDRRVELGPWKLCPELRELRHARTGTMTMRPSIAGRGQRQAALSERRKHLINGREMLGEALAVGQGVRPLAAVEVRFQVDFEQLANQAIAPGPSRPCRKAAASGRSPARAADSKRSQMASIRFQSDNDSPPSSAPS